MIREIQLKDKERWEKLYKGYADFYKVEMNNKILQTVWNWLHDKSHELKGIGYEIDGKIVGIAHYRKYSDKFIKDEEFAKKNKLGMWAMKFQYPWDFRKL